jgi:hypothetical protein
MKKSVLMLAFAFGVTGAFAQLSTRENDETVTKMGARPKAGDMAFVFGMSIADDSGMIANLFNGNSLKSGDILTYKYYNSDDMVIRLGLRLMNENTMMKGSGLDSGALYDPNLVAPPFTNIKEVKLSTKERMWEIVPGVEKHFLASNFFDAYVGADLYLGFGADKSIDEYTYINGDFNKVSRKTRTTDVGLGVVTGFNVFVANLPISIGLEYGWNAKWTFGGVTKVKEDMMVGSVAASAEYSEDNTAAVPTGAKYSKLKMREFNADSNQNVRIVAHIYFGK